MMITQQISPGTKDALKHTAIATWCREGFSRTLSTIVYFQNCMTWVWYFLTITGVSDIFPCAVSETRNIDIGGAVAETPSFLTCVGGSTAYGSGVVAHVAVVVGGWNAAVTGWIEIHCSLHLYDVLVLALEGTCTNQFIELNIKCEIKVYGHFLHEHNSGIPTICGGAVTVWVGRWMGNSQWHWCARW